MRLIDADALMPKLKFIREAEHQIYGKESWGFASKCITAVEDAPTIDEQPTVEPERKTGKWIEHNPHKWGLGIVFECSECGERIDCETSNFCPNCGTKMEETE